MVAKNNKIIIEKAFGQKSDGTPNDLSSKYYLASITKAITGLLFAQFLDQGLVTLDEPIGNYLNAFPKTGPNAVTFRQCFIHALGGLGGHGGMEHMWFENRIAGNLRNVETIKLRSYTGTGYNLVGKAMEIITGKSFIRLFQEHLFMPIKGDNIFIDDLGTSASMTVRDLAKLASILANKGVYGEKRFFSEDTFEKLLPLPVTKFFPDIKTTSWIKRLPEHGVGLHRFDDNKGYLSHGSATRCVFAINPKDKTIIIMTRNSFDELTYDQNFGKMLSFIEEGIIKKSDD